MGPDEPWSPGVRITGGGKRDFGVDASTPRPRTNDWPRMRQLGQYSPIPEIQLLRSLSRSELQHFHGAILSPDAPVTGTLDIMAQLSSALETLKMTFPIRSKPEMSTTLVPRRSGRFTNTTVPKFNGSMCWYQHQQVFDAIAKFNGWDDETAA